MYSAITVQRVLTKIQSSSINIIRTIPKHDTVLVIASVNQSAISLWDIDTNTPTLSMRGQLTNWSKGDSTHVTDICVTNCGENLIASYSDGTIRIWNWQTFECKKVLNGHSDSILSIDVSLDGCLIISSSNDGTMRLWNVNGGCIKKVNSNHRGSHSDIVCCVRFIKNWASESSESENSTIYEPKFISYGMDGDVKIWHVKNQSQCIPISTMENKIPLSRENCLITCTPDGSFFSLIGNLVDKVDLIECSSELKELYSIALESVSHDTCKSTKALDACYSPNRYWISIVESSGIVSTTDLESKLFVRANAHSTPLRKKSPQTPKCLVWSNDGTWLFVGCTDGSVVISKVETGEEVFAPTANLTVETEEWV